MRLIAIVITDVAIRSLASGGTISSRSRRDLVAISRLERGVAPPELGACGAKRVIQLAYPVCA